jgi:hypothetical protein
MAQFFCIFYGPIPAVAFHTIVHVATVSMKRGKVGIHIEISSETRSNG